MYYSFSQNETMIRIYISFFFIVLFTLVQAQDDRRSKYCYQDATIQTKAGETALSFEQETLLPSTVVRFSVKPLLNRIGYLITDSNNRVIKSQTSDFIELADLPAGKFRIWAFTYIGDILVEAGDIASEVPLASFCYGLTSNYVTLEIKGKETFTLQILHHNDGESALINAGENLVEVGGIARFKTVVDRQRAMATQNGYESILLSAGDNFLAGPAFTASLRLPPRSPYYDALGLAQLSYDAIGVGNHEFDFGPDVLARFIRDLGGENPPPFLSANLDFTNEGSLNALATQGRILPHTILTRGDEKIGVIGLTTPELSFVSSPRRTIVMTDLVGIVNKAVEALEAQGVNKIILISHLQALANELALIPSLKGVDIVIAGGGDEFLSNNPAEDAIPGFIEPEDVKGNYPLIAADANDQEVLVVTAPGGYTYLGNLTVTFSSAGEILEIDPQSGPVKVQDVAEDAQLLESVVAPISGFVDNLANNILGATEVELNGLRSDVRTKETNLGNLVADAVLWEANLLAANYGVERADVAIQNGGGIRNSVVVPANSLISELTTFNILPFPNFVSIVEAIPASQFKQILERAVSQVEESRGQFAQIAGFEFVYDPDASPQTVDETGQITTPGSRVRNVTLDDGTPIVIDGAVVEGAPDIRVATIDFLARGGDAYPFGDTPFTTVGVTYQQALATYLSLFLRGNVFAAQYPAGGNGRIKTVGEVSGLQIPGFNNASSLTNTFAVSPNPFQESLNLQYTVETPGTVNISMYDLNGQLIKTLFKGGQEKGRYFKAVDMPNQSLHKGLYYIVLQRPNAVETHPIVKQ